MNAAWQIGKTMVMTRHVTRDQVEYPQKISPICQYANDIQGMIYLKLSVSHSGVFRPLQPEKKTILTIGKNRNTWFACEH